MRIYTAADLSHELGAGYVLSKPILRPFANNIITIIKIGCVYEAQISKEQLSARINNANKHHSRPRAS
jgi:hypothetical protein